MTVLTVSCSCFESYEPGLSEASLQPAVNCWQAKTMFTPEVGTARIVVRLNYKRVQKMFHATFS